ncbi:MAG TPA: hypothetical protein VFA49_06125, partial [Chloroflexota bacterium]|nr:hypothetical protein [Chloroflexota bacterium]
MDAAHPGLGSLRSRPLDLSTLSTSRPLVLSTSRRRTMRETEGSVATLAFGIMDGFGDIETY